MNPAQTPYIISDTVTTYTAYNLPKRMGTMLVQVLTDTVGLAIRWDGGIPATTFPAADTWHLYKGSALNLGNEDIDTITVDVVGGASVDIQILCYPSKA